MSNLSPDQKDILRLQSSNCHIGTKNLNHYMKPYVESKTQEGLHLINPVLILEKIKLAAKVIVTIENPEDVIVMKLYIFKGCICKTLWLKSSYKICSLYRSCFNFIIKMDSRNIYKLNDKEIFRTKIINCYRSKI